MNDDVITKPELVLPRSMPRCALLFCHGIANGPEDRKKKLPLLLNYLARSHGLKDALDILRIAEWRSLGGWAEDIVDLTVHRIRRDEAVNDVAREIQDAMELLEFSASEANDSIPPRVIVLGHSMGQVMSVLALKRLAEKLGGNFGIPLYYISIGGPLGNCSPLFRVEMKWAFDEMGGGTPPVVEWVDLWNPDDPICADLVLGYKAPQGVTRSVRVDYPGHPTLSNPIKEHVAYWETDVLFDEIKKAVGTFGLAAYS